MFEFEELRDAFFPLRPTVLDKYESLRLLEENPKSLARIGDGEVDIMDGRSIPFQKYDPVLAEKMRSVLRTKRDDLYVALDNYFHAPSLNSPEFNRRFHRNHITQLRRFIMKEANRDILYLSTHCLLTYIDAYDPETCEKLMLREKKLFEGRKIALVAGKGILSKLDYDVFDLAAEKITIEAPSKNAFQEYQSLLDKITSTVGKDYMICIILGPTATVMASDLTDMGYLAWDVGHIAKDYDLYMKRVEKTHEMRVKFWAPD